MTISITKSEVAKLLNPSHDSSEVEGLTKLAETLVDKTNTEISTVQASNDTAFSTTLYDTNIYSTDGTVSAGSQTIVITKGSAISLDVPLPTVDGTKIRIINASGSAFAHVIEFLNVGANGVICSTESPQSGNVLTTPASAGVIAELEFYDDNWYMIAYDSGCVLSSSI